MLTQSKFEEEVQRWIPEGRPETGSSIVRDYLHDLARERAAYGDAKYCWDVDGARDVALMYTSYD